jgi:hypothetical protein
MKLGVPSLERAEDRQVVRGDERQDRPERAGAEEARSPRDRTAKPAITIATSPWRGGSPP